MKVVINGYAGITKAITDSYEQDVESMQEEIAKQRAQLQDEHKIALAEKVEKIRTLAEEEAQKIKQSSVARAKARAQEALLQVKAEQAAELEKLTKEALAKLPAKQKNAKVEALWKEIQDEADEEIARVEVPKGTTVPAKNVDAHLDGLEVIAHTKSGAMIRKTVDVSAQELAKLLKSEGIW